MKNLKKISMLLSLLAVITIPTVANATSGRAYPQRTYTNSGVSEQETISAEDLKVEEMEGIGYVSIKYNKNYCIELYANGTALLNGSHRTWTLKDDNTYTLVGETASYTFQIRNGKLYVASIDTEYEDTQITRIISDVSIEVEEPKVGKNPVYKLTKYPDLLTGDNVINWTQNGSMLITASKYEAGECGFIAFFDIPEGVDTYAVLSAKVNGQKAEITKVNSKIRIDYKFNVEKAEITNATATVSNLEVGKTASSCKLTIPSDAPYTATLSIAEHLNNGLPEMDLASAFQAGKKYRIVVTLVAKDDYKFASQVKGTINESKDTIYMVAAGKNRLVLDITMPEEEVKDVTEDQKDTAKEEKKEETKTQTEKYTWKKASDWAVKELESASKAKLIPALFDNEDLTTNITRKEFAHVAVKMYENISGQKAVAIATNPFTDTTDLEVLKAYNIGITNGTTDTTFSPDSLITREQMATMMTRALTKAGKNTARPTDAKLFADDVVFSNYAKDSIYYMSSIEIIKGVGDNKFDSKGNASREQALAISIRCVNKLAK